MAEALTQAMDFTDHLPSLWKQATAEEKAILQALAHGARDVPPSSARESLLEEEFIERDDEGHRVAVPLFARWIRRAHPASAA